MILVRLRAAQQRVLARLARPGSRHGALVRMRASAYAAAERDRGLQRHDAQQKEAAACGSSLLLQVPL